MKGVDDVSQSVYRAIVSAVIFYFALLAYAAVTGDLIARYAAEFVFGVIAIGVGVVLYLQSDGSPSAILGAAVCLVIGGALQFFYLFTRVPVVDQVTSLVVFVGIGLYIYAVWYAE